MDTLGTLDRPNVLSMTVGVAIEATGLSRSRLYEAMATGALPYRHNGARRLILVDDLKRYLESLPVGAHSAA